MWNQISKYVLKISDSAKELFSFYVKTGINLMEFNNILSNLFVYLVATLANKIASFSTDIVR